MINIKNVKKLCCEDPALIENYYEAINDKTKTWHCHHRLETELHLSSQELIDLNMYFNLKASDLIFLEPTVHRKIHMLSDSNPMKGKFGKLNPMYGKNAEDYMLKEKIIKKRKKQSENLTGSKNGRWHTKQMFKDGVYETVKYEDIEEHLNNGWIIKGRGWHK